METCLELGSIPLRLAETVCRLVRAEIGRMTVIPAMIGVDTIAHGQGLVITDAWLTYQQAERLRGFIRGIVATLTDDTGGTVAAVVRLPF